MIRGIASQGGWRKEGGMDLCCACPPLFSLPLATCLLRCPFSAWGPPLSGVKERPGAGGNGGSHHFQGGGPRRKASGMGTHLTMMALALGGGRNEQGCCPRRGGSKCDMQTLRYAHTDSHMHAQGHPGRLKDRSCWTHPHGDKGKGRRLLHWGAQRGGTHPRETDPCTYSRTGSHGDAVTHRGKEASLSPT